MTSDEIHIRRNYALIVSSIIIFTGLGRKAGAVATVMNKEKVTGLRRSHQILKSSADIPPSWLSVGIVRVDQDSDVFF